MNRRTFLKTSTFLTLLPMVGIKNLNELSPSDKMPLLFVGHGSPMNAIEDNEYSRMWNKVGKEIVRPKAILCVSAHWLTRGKTLFTAMEKPKTIHDFGGFPQELFNAQYPAPGAPQLAKGSKELIHSAVTELDHSWGLDHGTWSVLKPMFPLADIPTYQMSIDYSKSPEFHFYLAKELYALRSKGVLIIGSGNIVHNLGMLSFDNKVFDWAKEFDTKMKSFIDNRDFTSVVNFQKLGEISKMAHPTYDHFLPLIYTLGLIDAKDSIQYFNEKMDLGSISMRSLLVS